MTTKSLTVQIVESKTAWETFVQNVPGGTFMQSWNAGVQATNLGEKILRLGLYQEKNLIGVCLVTLVHAKRGNYLFIPYGPVLKQFTAEFFNPLSDYLRAYGKEHGYDFVRIAPFLERSEAFKTLFKQAGYHTAPIHMIAEDLWVLDIQVEEEILLQQMRKTNRNLIRRALKDQVRITASTDDSALSDFITLHEETRKRHQFVPYSNQLFQEQLHAFAPDNQALVFRGYHEDTLLAAAVIMYYGSMGSYHHGASIPSKIPVSYLLQWEAILEAKRRGCSLYNFWGIDTGNNKKHPFYGISHFKKGFGGRLLPLLPSQDLVLSARYPTTFAIETFRRVYRGFGLRRA